MSKFVAILAAAIMLMVASPAVAGVGDMVKGVNGVITCPMDVVHGMMEPARVVDMAKLHPKLDAMNVVTDRLGGMGVGVKNMLQRMVLGVVDIVTFPMTEKVGGAYSPDARYSVLDAVDKAK